MRYVIHKDVSKLKYALIMELYEDDNRMTADQEYAGLPANEALLLAEQDAYGYLAEVFFAVPSAFMVILESDGKYVSGLRLEPYMDGWLLTGLMTHASFRRRGCASALLHYALGQLPAATKVYSHVEQSNTCSLRFHKKYGFQLHQTWARMLNGGILHNYWTFLLQK